MTFDVSVIRHYYYFSANFLISAMRATGWIHLVICGLSVAHPSVTVAYHYKALAREAASNDDVWRVVDKIMMALVC